MSVRTAKCCCGILSVTVNGDPERVIACHCDYCQRRTGNIFQVSAQFFSDQIVEKSGQGKVYRGPDNRGVDYTFCTNCGSTVYWQLEYLRNYSKVPVYGIAAGCFVDHNFPRPDYECWTKNRHHWLNNIDGAIGYNEFSSEGMVPVYPE